MKCVVWITACIVLTGALLAQDGDTAIESSLRQQLRGQVLTLRNFNWGDRLVYDSDGKLIGGGPERSWTLAAKVQVESVSVFPDRIEISALRVFVPYRTRSGPQFVVQRRVRTTLVIARDPAHADGAAAHHQLERVFLRQDESLAALLPEAWQGCTPEQLNKSGGCAPLPSGNAASSTPVHRAGRDGVTVPEVLTVQRVAPTPEAVEAGYVCQTVLRLVVDEQGRPTKIRLVRPCGMGLDELRMGAVSHWSFRPARLKGTAVPILVDIEVD